MAHWWSPRHEWSGILNSHERTALTKLNYGPALIGYWYGGLIRDKTFDNVKVWPGTDCRYIFCTLGLTAVFREGRLRRSAINLSTIHFIALFFCETYDWLRLIRHQIFIKAALKTYVNKTDWSGSVWSESTYYLILTKLYSNKIVSNNLSPQERERGKKHPEKGKHTKNRTSHKANPPKPLWRNQHHHGGRTHARFRVGEILGSNQSNRSPNELNNNPLPVVSDQNWLSW